MSKSARRHTRRTFIARSASLAAGSVAAAPLLPLLKASAAAPAAAFRSDWHLCPGRVWLGPAYWANPMQDWQIANGRIECTNAAPDRNVHALTRHLGERPGNLSLSVRVGRAEGGPLAKGKGSAGFRIGIQGPLREYRNSLIFGRGLDAGISAGGALFIGDVRSAKPGTVRLDTDWVELVLVAEPNEDRYTVTLAVLDLTGRQLGRVTREVPADQLTGNVALVNNFGTATGPGGAGKARKKADTGYNPGVDRFWFADWKISGSKIEAHADHAFGPILFSQYTLSGGVLKMTAQMPPMGPQDEPAVRLEVRKGSRWTTLAEERIHPEARTATFRIENWDDKRDVPYRLAYLLKFRDGRSEHHYWTGTVRRDPVDKAVLTVADVSCNIHAAFPNAHYTANMARLDPDLLAFTGDQFYESTGGYGVVRTPPGAPLDKAMIDYLRKWYIHGWTWRELMRDRPSVSIPDDHDVYQGNIWGESGAPQTGTQEAGGYNMAAPWVNVVHRTQTAHHPDPYDPTPVKQGITQYFGPLTYGRVSFAILADRQYKSAPEGKVPPTGGRADHVKDTAFDPKVADLPGLELLGPKQEQFLREWAADWRGADMKAVISQTIFTAMATTHGAERMILRADYDANGWPQTARNRALRELRKAFAFHIAGDQHLPAVVHYGIDAHRDAGVAFAGPAVNVGYPRWWEPARAPWTKPKNPDEVTGDFTDGFGHPLTVLAVKNGAAEPKSGDVLQFLEEKASGLGVVRFDKRRRKIVVECWPFLADPTKKGTQFPGWPVTIDLLDNYGRQTAAHLPALNVSGVNNPVVQVVAEPGGELLYNLRIAGRRFRPHVFAPGRYTVRIGEPDTGRWKTLTGLEAIAGNPARLEVRV